MHNTTRYLIILLAIALSLGGCRAKKDSRQATRLPEPDGAMKAVRFGELYVTGCGERVKGNLQEALKLFQECLNLEPDNPAVHYELATIYKLLGNNELALTHAKVCAQADAMNEYYQLLLIDCYNANKQYGPAVKVREALIRNFPAKNDFKEDLAIQYAIMGQYDKSFRIYDDLERLYGINEQITLNKVKLLKSQKKYRETEAELRKLSESNPQEPRYYAYLAEFYLERRELEKAKQMYDKIIALDPENAAVNLALHDYFAAKGKDDLAFDHLKKAFRNKELDIGTKASILGSFYLRAENGSAEAKDKGVQLAQILLELYPSATESNAMYADFLRLEKKVSEASLYYYRAALNEKRDYRVWDNLLYTDNELGHYDSLERHSNMAIELFPNQPQNYLYKSVATSQQKRYSESLAALKEGLEYVGDDKVQRVKFLSALGDVYHYLKEYASSDKSFEEALKTNPDDTYVLNNYAYYLSLRKEQLPRAEKLSKHANDLRPNDRNYMDTYGWILYQQQKYTEAEKWLSRAASLGPKNATILEHYGDVLYKLNRIEEALRFWQAAKAAGGQSEELTNKIKEGVLK